MEKKPKILKCIILSSSRQDPLIYKLLHPYAEILKKDGRIISYFSFYEIGINGEHTIHLYLFYQNKEVLDALKIAIKLVVQFYPLPKTQQCNVTFLDDPTHVAFYQQDAQILGELGTDVWEKFLIKTNDLSTLILQRTNNNYRKVLALFLDIMIANTTLIFGDIRRGYLSYRSHVNGYFTLFVDPIKAKEIFNNEYLKLRNTVLSRIKYILSDTNPVKLQDLSTIQDHWCYIIKEFIEYIRPLIQKKQIIFADNFDITSPHDNEENTKLSNHFTTYSSFHAYILQNQDFLKYMQTNIDFLTFRLITMCLYIFMQRLGVKKYDKYLLCYLISAAVEEQYNINPESLITKFYLTQEGTPAIKY